MKYEVEFILHLCLTSEQERKEIQQSLDSRLNGFVGNGIIDKDTNLSGNKEYSLKSLFNPSTPEDLMVSGSRNRLYSSDISLYQVNHNIDKNHPSFLQKQENEEKDITREDNIQPNIQINKTSHIDCEKSQENSVDYIEKISWSEPNYLESQDPDLKAKDKTSLLKKNYFCKEIGLDWKNGKGNIVIEHDDIINTPSLRKGRKSWEAGNVTCVNT